MYPLGHPAPEGNARVLLKLEYESPTGSTTDRIALVPPLFAELFQKYEAMRG